MEYNDNYIIAENNDSKNEIAKKREKNNGSNNGSAYS